MATPTIGKQQAKNTLSGKKKKPEVIKNVLAKPYQNYWPSLTPEDNSRLLDTLNKFLPRVQTSKPSVPYSVIKNVPVSDRKELRKKFSSNEEVTPNNDIIFGVNEVAKTLKKQEAASILVDHDVQPRILVQHVLDQAVLYNVPVLVVFGLKTVSRQRCGVGSAAVAIAKSASPESPLGVIHQTVYEIHESYPVPMQHIHSVRQLDISTITIADSEDGRSIMEVMDGEEVHNFHLKKPAKGRAFELEQPKKEEVFIQLGMAGGEEPAPKRRKTDGREYQSLRVNRVKGDKERNKNKMKRLKRKAHKKV